MLAAQEAPPLEGDPKDAAQMVTAYINTQCAAFASQEQSSQVAREAISDSRVDVVLYFLPTNARVSPFDQAVMDTIGRTALVLPVMCKVRCCSCSSRAPPWHHVVSCCICTAAHILFFWVC